MKTISKQGLLNANTSIAAPLSHTLANRGRKKAPENGGALGGSPANNPMRASAGAFPGSAKEHEFDHAKGKTTKRQEHRPSINQESGTEAELIALRHHLERILDLRTGQLTRRIALLESCNAALCDKLALARMELAELKRQSPEPAIRPEPATQSNPPAVTGNYNMRPEGISDWARNMIRWRAAAAA